MKTLIIGGSSAIGQLLQLHEGEIYKATSKEFNVCKPISWPDVDVVINLAGIIDFNDLCRYSILTKKLVEVNCIGAVNILSEFIPQMRSRKFGRIIFISSVFSAINVKGYGVYSASKAFVDKLVKVAAIENAEYGITINSIQLGYTGIGMGDHRDREIAIKKPALKRFVTMDELQNAIKFIIDTEYYTGQNLRLDGGIK